MGAFKRAGAGLWCGVLALFALGSASDRMWWAVAFFAVAIVAVLPILALRQRLAALGVSDKMRVLINIGAALLGVIAIGLQASPSSQANSATSTATTSPTSGKAEVVRLAAEANNRRATLRTEVKALFAEVTRLDSECARGSEKASTLLKRGNVYAAYPIVRDARTTCSEAGRGIRALNAPPSTDGEGEDAFEEAITVCANGQDMKSLAFIKLAEVLDGDMKPSTVTTAKEYMEQGGNASMYCAAKFITAASKVGVSTDIFGAKRS